jgi:hypothetical protein
VLAVVLRNGTLNALAVVDVVAVTFVAFVAVPDTVPTASVFVLGLYVNSAAESCSSP